MARAERPLVIAHRGASGYRPENTPAAFELAVEQRADMIEIDLHRSRDGEIVIRHDAELESLGGQLEISQTDWAEIAQLDAGEGQRIPTLDEVLDAFGTRMPFNLEIKRGTDADYPELERLALEAVERRGLLASMLFSSFSNTVLERLRAHSSQARLAVLVSPRRPEGVFDRAAAVGAEAVNPWIGLAKADLVERAHGLGLAVYPYTVNERADMQRLLEVGVDGMFTNYPDVLRELLGSPRGQSRLGR